ncbi:MAG: biotin--[Lachnospiraceae bacterium]|nr:biotin--[acetyl-CoA-carboxylase] ligase [Lachnospiraceae bacterium]
MTKNNVLAILMQSKDFVSGEAISRQLGLSRTAVNMAVKTLRAEGYQIESVTNRGYMLINAPDVLTRGALMGYLPGRRMNNVECFDVVDSTNHEMMKLAVDGAPNGQVIIANQQKRGKGRRGRTFSSPAGQGIYMSYLMIPPYEVKRRIASSGNNSLWSAITSWTAVTVAKTIYNLCGVRPDIKWVNDLYMNGRKICGILTQTTFDAEVSEIQNIIIGIGINVHEDYEDFPEEIRDIAGSIWSETGSRIIRAELASELIHALDEMCERWPGDMEEYLDNYRRWNIVTGRDVMVNYGDNSEQVHVDAIGDDFSLIVTDQKGEQKHLICGDVSLKL